VDRLRRHYQSQEDRDRQLPFLKNQPIVVLNACESMGGGLEPATNNDFVATFLRNGATAVVATESSVWVDFADRFGRDLVEALFHGADAAESLHIVRTRHLKDRRNPLGLLYALYGNPSAHYVGQHSTTHPSSTTEDDI
jgi:hypothetical protein